MSGKEFIEIKIAKKNDLEEILRLQKIVYQSEAEIYNDFNIPPLHQTIEELKEEFRRSIFLKALKNNKIIGSVRAYRDKESCFIGKLIVHPEYQNQGLGTLILRKIENNFSYADRFELFTGFKSEKNLYLYQKLGYKIFKTEELNENVKFLYLEKYNTKSINEKIRVRFEEISFSYDDFIPKVVPYYNEMLTALINSIPFETYQKIKIVDLGSGTGNLSKLIKMYFPNSKLTMIDVSENMIELAKKKLSGFNNVEFFLDDFNTLSFTAQYDVIISSLALHHLRSDEDKVQFYTKIYDALNQGGVFYNLDNILGSSNYLQDMYIKQWTDFLRNNYSVDDIERILIDHRQEDCPAILFNQLKWLDNIGFKFIDVIWKCYYFAVYGGVK
ncbi:MAG: GNAT family N-acetyltransferase [Candidatus Odinarchaeota archaeon]